MRTRMMEMDDNLLFGESTYIQGPSCRRFSLSVLVPIVYFFYPRLSLCIHYPCLSSSISLSVVVPREVNYARR